MLFFQWMTGFPILCLFCILSRMAQISAETLLRRPDLRRLVREGKIDLATARRACAIPSGLITEFEAVLGAVSFSSARIFLTRLGEALAGKTPEEARALTARLLAARRPEEELAAIRMPELTEMERSFREITGRLLKGTGVSLKAPPCFEGGRFSVEFSFATPEELTRKIRVLEKLAADGQDLYELL